MKLELQITNGKKTRLFAITSKTGEVLKGWEWNEFIYPCLENASDYAFLDLITGYENAFEVIEYCYVEGNIVKDTVETEEGEFSYLYLLDGKEASYNDVWEALNPIV